MAHTLALTCNTINRKDVIPSSLCGNPTNDMRKTETGVAKADSRVSMNMFQLRSRCGESLTATLCWTRMPSIVLRKWNKTCSSKRTMQCRNMNCIDDEIINKVMSWAKLGEFKTTSKNRRTTNFAPTNALKQLKTN